MSSKPPALEQAQTVDQPPTPDSLEALPTLDTLDQALAAALSPATAEELPEGRVIAGKYKVIRRLGSGGMGQVFLAEHAGTGGLVALKRLQETTPNPKARKRFQLEAQNAASLQHVNNIRVTDYGEDQDQHPYLVMEYIEGQPLDRLLEAEGPLPWPRVAHVLCQVLAALWEAHESPRRIVHRDIKPANILICDLPGSPDHVKVLDYGISRALGASGADTQGAIGSPHTMAPEQWEGRAIDGRADLYAVGCTAYQLLSGRPLFETDSLGSLGYHHLHVEPPPLASLAIPPGAEAWIARLLAKSPDDRYPSARAALDALQHLESPALPLPVQPAGARRAPLAALLAIAGVVVVGTLWVVLDSQPPAAPAPTPTPTANTPQAAPLSLRRCAEEEGSCTASSPAIEAHAWCTPDGRQVACCVHGLVPDGDEGVCACAPGGVSTPHDFTAACQAADGPDRQRFQIKDIIQTQLAPSVRRCYEQGLTDAPLLQGKLVFSFDLGPIGEVHDAKISEGAFPSPEVQRCILQALRAQRFKPPADGWVHIKYPFLLHTLEESAP